MDLRVKEVCREKGTTVTGLADRLGMKQVSLSRIINGNPTV
jgi:plasmid maintenance system antidote protein VapI